ncbi:MAG TPA: kynureninase [Steroidobacteraceae bacterium]
MSDRPCNAGEEAARLDKEDPLASFADEFHFPSDVNGRKLVYLAGHSLGLAPRRAAALIEEELSGWRALGVLGHHQGLRPWISYHEQLAEPLAHLTGSQANEVVAMNSLTINLHLMMVSFFRPEGRRSKILIEQSAFPSDRYAVLSQLKFHGLSERDLVEVAPRRGERLLRNADVLEAIERNAGELALLLLPGVQYLSGQRLDLAPLITAGRRVGAAVGVDLAHAIGNTPLELHDWNADFAVWCSYKYLNAGPGAVGGCFVHERHANGKLPRFAGWWGHDKEARFMFEPGFRPIAGAEGWQVSNPPIFSTAPLIASLELFERAGMARLREKSLALTAFLRQLIESRLAGRIDIITPSAPGEHGSQLSLRVLKSPADARRYQEALSADGLIADWREPDVIRMAPTPLYNSFSDVLTAVDMLERTL